MQLNRKRSVPVLLTETALKEIYSVVLQPEEWVSADGSLSRLKCFLAAIAMKVESDLRNGESNTFILNEYNTDVLVNTALLDAFGQDILLLYQLSTRGKLYNPIIVRSKSDLIGKGFQSLQSLQLEPLKFYKRQEELLFPFELKDFDLSRAHHLLRERLERFPVNARELPLEILFSRLLSSLTFSLRMCKHDFRYPLPIYNLKYGVIQWLLPFWINNSFIATPELCMIVANVNGSAQIKTVVGIDEAYADARVLTNPGNSWLMGIKCNS